MRHGQSQWRVQQNNKRQIAMWTGLSGMVRDGSYSKINKIQKQAELFQWSSPGQEGNSKP